MFCLVKLEGFLGCEVLNSRTNTREGPAQCPVIDLRFAWPRCLEMFKKYPSKWWLLMVMNNILANPIKKSTNPIDVKCPLNHGCLIGILLSYFMIA